MSALLVTVHLRWKKLTKNEKRKTKYKKFTLNIWIELRGVVLLEVRGHFWDPSKLNVVFVFFLKVEWKVCVYRGQDQSGSFPDTLFAGLF